MTGRLHSLRGLATAAMCALLLLVLSPSESVCCARSGASGAHTAGVKALAPTVATGQRVHLATQTSHVVADADWYRRHSTGVGLASVAAGASYVSALPTSTTRSRAPPVS